MNWLTKYSGAGSAFELRSVNGGNFDKIQISTNYML
jgi:hypothetical protein